MLMQNVRSQLTAAMKAKDETKKGILRVLLGDLSTLESRSGKETTDDDVKKVIKKLVENNLETMGYLNNQNSDSFNKLKEENNILNSFLPQTLTIKQMKHALAIVSQPIVSEIQTAKSDGQATGLALKFFKAGKFEVNSNDVIALVKELRSCDSETFFKEIFNA